MPNTAVNRIRNFKPNCAFQPRTQHRNDGPTLNAQNKSSKRSVPIPYGHHLYARAKRAECMEHNFRKAERLYYQAILKNDRGESAVKDLASLLHQQGKTKEAIKLMEEYQRLAIEEPSKYVNLLSTLKQQVVPSENSRKKIIKITELGASDDNDSVIGMFGNPLRIDKVEIKTIKGYRVAFVFFVSHSSARKTVESFKYFEDFNVEWVDEQYQVLENANPGLHKSEYRRKNPPFNYKLFDRDPDNWYLTLPIDTRTPKSIFENEESIRSPCTLLGQELYGEILSSP